MLSKEKVIAFVADLPEHFTLDDLVERLIVIEKIENGLEQVRNGLVLSSNDVKEKIKSWRK